MNTRINQTAVKDAKPPASGYIILFDNKLDGFGLRVTAAGSKSFVYNYRDANGDKRRCTIGKSPKWTADAARDEVEFKLIPEIHKGADPVRDKKAKRDEPRLADLAKEYIEQHAEMKKRKKSIYEDNRMLNNIILPKIGTLRVSAISRRDVEKVHNSLRKTPYQANRVLALLSKMFSFAMDGEMRKDNPAKRIKRFKEDRRENWFSREQLQALALALDNYAEQDAADALRLLILTGARPGEVIGATWPMFDLDRGIWNKPSHHVKQKKAEHMPLNPTAVGILRRMAEHKTSIYLFPGREPSKADASREKRARTTLRNAWKQICKAAGLATEYHVKGKRGKPLPRWKANVRVYDLRHTFASHLVSRNWSLQLVGKLLGHTQAATTERYAHVADAALRNVTNDFPDVLALPEKTA